MRQLTIALAIVASMAGSGCGSSSKKDQTRDDRRDSKKEALEDDLRTRSSIPPRPLPSPDRSVEKSVDGPVEAIVEPRPKSVEDEPAGSAPPRGGPTTETALLLSYQYWDGAPPECARSRIIQFVESLLKQDHCRISRADSSPTAELSIKHCVVGSQDDGGVPCKLIYDGEIWIEWTSGETNYDLLGRGVVRKQCTREDGVSAYVSMSASSRERAQEHAEERLEKRLREKCEAP